MDEEPLLRVVRGIPTPEELAALFGALASLSSPADGPAPGHRSRDPIVPT
jgi:hypothetical protein